MFNAMYAGSEIIVVGKLLLGVSARTLSGVIRAKCSDGDVSYTVDNIIHVNSEQLSMYFKLLTSSKDKVGDFVERMWAIYSLEELEHTAVVAKTLNKDRDIAQRRTLFNKIVTIAMKVRSNYLLSVFFFDTWTSNFCSLVT